MVNELYEKTRIKLFLNKEKQVINEYCKIDLNSDGLISQNGMAFMTLQLCIITNHLKKNYTLIIQNSLPIFSMRQSKRNINEICNQILQFKFVF